MFITMRVEYDDTMVGANRIADSIFDNEGIETVEILEVGE